jgi:hypothetical protein
MKLLDTSVLLSRHAPLHRAPASDFNLQPATHCAHTKKNRVHRNVNAV